MKKALVAVGVVIVVVGLGVYLALQSNKPVEKNDFAFVPSDSDLLRNLQTAGLDALQAEGQVLHIHQHIDITVNGSDVTVPANIGVGATFISPLHTHDSNGILHVESPVEKDFRLGQFFTQWGVRFDSDCIATYCADDKSKLLVAINGELVSNAPDHVLKEHDQIHIWYGPSAENPELRKEYVFPKGL